MCCGNLQQVFVVIWHNAPIPLRLSGFPLCYIQLHGKCTCLLLALGLCKRSTMHSLLILRYVRMGWHTSPQKCPFCRELQTPSYTRFLLTTQVCHIQHLDWYSILQVHLSVQHTDCISCYMCKRSSFSIFHFYCHQFCHPFWFSFYCWTSTWSTVVT